MQSWYEELDDAGLRATGSPEHEKFIDVLWERMERMGLADVRSEAVPFERWTPSSWSLEILDGQDSGKVPVAWYIPYSGSLPPQGFTGHLEYVPDSADPAKGSLNGKIVLIDITIPRTNLGVMGRMAYSQYDPNHVLALDREYVRVWVGNMGRKLAQIRAAGPAAVIAALPLDSAAAKGLYTPYDGLVRKCPGIYVDQDQGARLKEVARTSARVRMTLVATSEQVNSRNLMSVIPGRSSELIVLHSHTDGPNGIEDNGPNIILGMTQYLARIPRELLPRSLMVLLTSGHFAGGVGSRHFVNHHREDLLPRIAACLTIEHVGARDMRLTDRGAFEATDKIEPAIVFMPPRADELAKIVVQGLAACNLGGAFLAGPTNLNPNNMETDSAWPGEGEYMWNNAGLPDANYITGPNYLFSSGFDTTKQTDFALLHSASVGFVDATLELMRAPKSRLAVSPPPDAPQA
jgi:hypothetical protein